MKSKVKLRIKSLSKKYVIISYIQLVLGMIMFVLLLTNNTKDIFNDMYVRIIYLSFIGVFLFGGLLTMQVSVHYTLKLKRYLNYIKLYRERVVVQTIFDLLIEGRDIDAINYYNSTNWITLELQNYVQGYINGYCTSSPNKDIVNRATNSHNKQISYLLPNKLKL